MSPSVPTPNSSSDQLEANLLYSQSTYDLFATSSPPSSSVLHAPSFALQRFCEQRPTDATALHLHALIAERLGQYDLALAQITRSVAVLEQAYEESETPEVESRFAIAQSNLGRLHLALGNYTSSVDAFAGTLGLISPEDESVRARRLRVHAKFGSGLAQYWLGELDESLAMFQAALDELESRPMGAMKGQVSVLLAQALWGMGGEDEKEAAKSTLLEWSVVLSSSLPERPRRLTNVPSILAASPPTRPISTPSPLSLRSGLSPRTLPSWMLRWLRSSPSRSTDVKRSISLEILTGCSSATTSPRWVTSPHHTPMSLSRV